MVSWTGFRAACAAVAAFTLLHLAGCGVLPRHKPAEEAPPLPPIVDTHGGSSGGLFTPERPWTLVSDSRAFRAGDILTVILQETTHARKSADTSFGKQTSIEVTPAVVGGKTVDTDVNVGAQREFSGNATSTQQNALQGAITVIVQEVLPNGLLRVAGEKSLYLNQGEEIIRLVGYVRPEDIDTDNRVSSQRVANARIAYSGRGTLHNANRAGWLTRFFNSPWMPL